MTRKAYTIVELLVVVGILAIVMAIATPVLLRAKEAAKETKCASNMHQLWEAMALYRERYGGGPAYGNCYAMGLPSLPKYATQIEGGLTREVHTCTGMPSLGTTQAAYTYMVVPPNWNYPKEAMTQWQAYSQEVGEHMILFVDPNHMAPVFQDSPYTSKRVQGIYLDGQLKKFVKRGDWSSYEFWK
ncbi:MAG: type II secretion system protein [Fimbriimonadales bacterium]